MRLATVVSRLMAAGLAVCAWSPLVVAQGQTKPPAAQPVPAANAAPQQQQPAQVPVPVPAVRPGAPGSGWTAMTTGDQGTVLEARQLETVGKVNGYFNALINLKGSFVQTNAENKRQRGRFYVKRPGKFRFDYAAPSRQTIISDGRILGVIDQDLGNEDATELDNTPFRILLRKDVDLVRDARIIEVGEDAEQIVLTLQDKSPDAPGAIRLVLTKKPTLELKQWTTLDAQGLETKVEISDLNRTDEIDSKLFDRSSLAIRKLQ